MPLQATSGAASYDAFGGGVAAVPNYIEECFSTYLYTGNGSTQTITNGIDLAGKGGLVWIKNRINANAHALFDTARGRTKLLRTNLTNAEVTDSSAISSFNAVGFSLDAGDYGITNDSGQNYASWTFREQPKFFDVVTYTGNGTAGRQIAHSLGSTPGFLVVKRTDSTSNWSTWHTSIPNAYMSLDTTNPQNTDNGVLWGNGSTHIDPTSTVFTVSSNAQVNASGGTYVAYLYAHDAGGFGLTGTDNVISCGSFTGASEAASVTLGWEPQWVMVKRTDSTGNWFMFDNMRGMFAPTQLGAGLFANLTNAEISPYGNVPFITSTGFFWNGVNNFVAAGSPSYIYIAIRRGPMKVPTDGTKVFVPVTATANSVITTNFPVDLLLDAEISGGNKFAFSRLIGGPLLQLNLTDAEVSGDRWFFASNTTTQDLTRGANPGVFWNFQRAPSFMDVVCYTGTNTDNSNKAHNLGVAPELIILKTRSAPGSPYDNWYTWQKDITEDKYLYLNTTSAEITAPNPTFGPFGTYAQMTATTWRVQNAGIIDRSGDTYVAYLFASCPGVSKVFSFTGNGSTQTIDCGFTGGARFVLLKASSATGGWYVYDTARGMTVLTDPYLQLNSTAAETATLGSVTTVSTGFAVNEAITTGVNTNGVTYIGLAIS